MSALDLSALFRIGYGLYVVTCREGDRDNGCIVNTVVQVTNTPNRVAVTVNKSNYTHDVIVRTGRMNINCLTEDTPFAVFQHFGFQSGRNVDKFNGATPERSENGVSILPAFSNAFLSLDVKQYVDLDTHGMFICTVSEAQVLSDAPSVTYAYYHAHIKPKPPKKKGYVCKICGYVYEGDSLPPDFICPLCKHPASDFEKME